MGMFENLRGSAEITPHGGMISLNTLGSVPQERGEAGLATVRALGSDAGDSYAVGDAVVYSFGGDVLDLGNHKIVFIEPYMIVGKYEFSPEAKEVWDTVMSGEKPENFPF